MKLKLKFRSKPKRFLYRGTTCLNCKHALDISECYCSYCGQKNSSKPLTLKVLLTEFFAGLFSYDSRFRKTISALIFNPGKISRDYVSGKRVSYVNPFRFFISTAIIFFLAVSWINRDQLIDLETLAKDEASSPSESMNYEFDFEDSSPASKMQAYIKEHPNAKFTEAVEANVVEDEMLNKVKFDFLLGYSRLVNNPKAFINFLLPKLPFFLFFYIPILTLFNTIIYVRRKIPYSHHLIFNYNQQTVFLILLFLALMVDFVGIGIWMLVYLFYLYKSMRKFYNQGRLKTLLKEFILINCYLFSNGVVILSLAAISIIFF